jgi:hypothetical protein
MLDAYHPCSQADFTPDPEPLRNRQMDEKTRRILEMGQRALDFCRAHPDSSPEYMATVARLESLLARAEELELQEKVIPFPQRTQGDPPDPAA